MLDVDDKTPARLLSDGEYFGELAVLFGGKRTRSIVAVTHAHLYSQEHEDLGRVLRDQPECIDNMIRNICTIYDRKDVEHLKQVIKGSVGSCRGVSP